MAMQKSQSYKPLLTAYMALTLTISCGQSNFQGKSTGSTEDVQSDFALNWRWQCTGEYPAIDASSPDKIFIQGEGPHQLEGDKINGAPVRLNGNVCAGESLERHIILVIDVSGSMTQEPGANDPVVNGTCGRFEAVKSVLEAASAGGRAKFGLVTFSSSLIASSTGLFATQDELFADLLAQGAYTSASELICDGLNGTNYESGLVAGSTILNASSGQAAREIYFISDGEPSAGQDGKDTAATLRTNTTIATVMVGSSDDSILKEDIASKDERGIPLHSRAENSSDLADVLAALAENHIEKGSLAYRAVGQEDWQTMDIKDKIDGSEFDFKAFSVDTGSGSGVEIEIVYSDRFGNEQRHKGQIIWSSGD